MEFWTMNRETAEHVAELAAKLAQYPYTPEAFKLTSGEMHQPARLDPCPAHVAAREAIALCALATRVHRTSEQECSGQISEKRGEFLRHRQRTQLAEILGRFGLCGSLQTDPRGWPIALHANETDREGWDRCGSPSELLRVTPHA
jgi:hypothetical protein